MTSQPNARHSASDNLTTRKIVCSAPAIELSKKLARSAPVAACCRHKTIAGRQVDPLHFGGAPCRQTPHGAFGIRGLGDPAPLGSVAVGGAGSPRRPEECGGVGVVFRCQAYSPRDGQTRMQGSRIEAK